MMTNFRSFRCFSRRHLALISIIDMFGESSMNSGASATSLIRRASRAQSSSFICPVRMVDNGTRASADSSRMVISLRPISRLNSTVLMLFLMAAARAKSSASVELWVGIMLRPARYRRSRLSTCTHRTGWEGTGRTSAKYRHGSRRALRDRREPTPAATSRPERDCSIEAERAIACLGHRDAGSSRRAWAISLVVTTRGGEARRSSGDSR